MLCVVSYLGNKMVHALVDAGEPVAVPAKAQRQSLVTEPICATEPGFYRRSVTATD